MIAGMTQATRDLADGSQMPLLGLGAWQVPDAPECVRAVRWALELGYRHIDTAQAYRNEASAGKALAQSIIDRDDVFITTKFNEAPRRLAGGAQEVLRSLA
jgi:methylglyoxal/glyoxal reductase